MPHMCRYPVFGNKLFTDCSLRRLAVPLRRNRQRTETWPNDGADDRHPRSARDRRSEFQRGWNICGLQGACIPDAISRCQLRRPRPGTLRYLVFTGVTTVQHPSSGSRRRDTALMLVALTLGLATFAGGIVAIARPTGKLFGLPSFPFFLFGVLGVSGAMGDFKTMRAGVLRGAPRLSRHLWRMCMALFITAASFFSIRARVAAIL